MPILVVMLRPDRSDQQDAYLSLLETVVFCKGSGKVEAEFD